LAPKRESGLPKRSQAHPGAAIVIAYALGVLATIQFGRFAPAAATLMDDLSIDLEAFGWLLSLINAAPAACGLLAGFIAIRYGLKRSLFYAALALALAVLASAATSNLTLLLVLRFAEGFAYLLIVVAAPTVIALFARPAMRTVLLSLWGSYFFIGLSLSSVAGGWLADIYGWRMWFLICGLGMLVTAACAQIWFPNAAETTPPVRREQAAHRFPLAFWCLAGAFFGIVLLSASMPATLPVFLIERFGFSQAAAGLAAGTVALGSLAGNLCYGVLSRWTSDRVFLVIANPSLLALGVTIYAVGSDLAVVLIASCASAFFLLGLLAAQAFATVPKLVGNVEQVGLANGLLIQFGSVGGLAGAPLFGWLAATWGWSSVAAILAITAAFQLSLLLVVFRPPESTR